MKRRHILGAALALPAVARAQTPGGKIGYAYVGPESLAESRLQTILSGVRAAGQPVTRDDIAMKIPGPDIVNLAPAIKELLGQNLSAFIAAGPAALRLAHQMSKTVPILAYDFETDPVAEGYAASPARPGGNVSGVFLDLPGFAGKWIELLRECMPQLSRLSLLWDPNAGRIQSDALETAAGPLGIKTDLIAVRGPDDYGPAFVTARQRGAQAAVLLSSPLVFIQVKALGEMAARERMPAITMFSEFARGGGMISYGPNLLAAFKQTSFMAGKIRGGASIATLPLERPSTFELVVNQRAAEALGVKIPASIQARADEVID
jgi:putative tryptophan/tyrosine transport system substrate-binding protein